MLGRSDRRIDLLADFKPNVAPQPLRVRRQLEGQQILARAVGRREVNGTDSQQLEELELESAPAELGGFRRAASAAAKRPASILPLIR